MNVIACFIPYIAVLVGMALFRNAWLAIGLYHLGIVAFMLILRPPELKERLRHGFQRPLLVPSMVICALAAPVIFYLWPWLGRPDVNMQEWLASYGLQGKAWRIFIPYFSMVHPVLEEAHWRMLTDHTTYKLLRWQDAVFAGYHLLVLGSIVQTPWLLLVFGTLIVASSFWRWAAHRSNGYGLTVVTHAVADSAVIAGAIWRMH